MGLPPSTSAKASDSLLTGGLGLAQSLLGVGFMRWFVVMFVVGSSCVALRSEAARAGTRTAKAAHLEALQATVDLHRANVAFGSDARYDAYRSHVGLHGPVKFTRFGNTVVVRGDHIAIERDGQQTRASITQLVELGVTGPKQLRALLDEAVVRAVEPTQAMNAATIEAAHATLKQRAADKAALLDLMRHPAKHPDLKLLLDYLGSKMWGNDAPTLARQLSLSTKKSGELVLKLGKNGDAVIVHDTHQWSHRDTDEVALVRAMQATGLRGPGDLEALVADALVRAADVEGSSADPKVVARARQELARQRPVAEELRGFVRNPRTHKQLAMAADLMAMTGAGVLEERARVNKPFVFARHNHYALMLGVFNQYDFSNNLSLVDAKTLEPVGWHTTYGSREDISATWDDLRRVNIRSRADFDSAVEHGLLDEFPLSSLPVLTSE